MHVRPCRDCLQLVAHNANFDPIITRLSDITDAGTSSVSVFRKDNNLLRDTLLILLVAASCVLIGNSVNANERPASVFIISRTQAYAEPV